MNAPRPAIVIGALLLLATLLVYARASSHPFISYDDETYVVENEQVRRGLSLDGVAWAFGSFRASNWHPLTWLSHMLDVELFGMDAGRHHLTSVVLHAANGILLLWLLLRMTGALWPSAFVAAAFALHPLHVESVAWIAERKDVLAGFLGLLALLAYSGYARRPGWLRYAAVGLIFAAGLLAKPMLVTLPFVMLLLDIWPLGRWQPFGEVVGPGAAARPARLLVEKLPLLCLSAASCVVTFIAQSQSGAVSSLAAIPFDVRLENALVSYLVYAGKVVWPSGLAVLYPHPEHATLALTASATLALAAVTGGLLFVASHRRPAPLIGWLWYLGMLVPVIGLVQVGMQGMADRYTYLPSIGLFVALAFGLPLLVDDASAWKRVWSRGLGVVALAAVLGWSALSVRQLEHWRSTFALFLHAAAVTQDNYVAHNKLGRAYRVDGQLDEAADHYTRALGIKPDLASAAMNLGVVRAAQGRFAEAEERLLAALRLDPGLAPAAANLGYVRLQTGRRDEAIRLFEQAIELDPGDPLMAAAYANLSTLRYQDGRTDEGRALLERAVALDPGSADYRYRFGLALGEADRIDEARAQLERALLFDPDHEKARRALEQLDTAR